MASNRHQKKPQDWKENPNWENQKGSCRSTFAAGKALDGGNLIWRWITKFIEVVILTEIFPLPDSEPKQDRPKLNTDEKKYPFIFYFC